MKKTDPRLIINLNISDEDFEKHIETAVDKYIDSILDNTVEGKVTTAIKKYVDKRIDAILNERRYDSASLINGKNLSAHIADIARPKVHAVVSDCIAKEVANALMTKLST